ncbi:MAG TPA: hypothetical protein DDY72_02390 [Verrucomicrobia bacterium]|mgnify:FL=1|nr:hypothetical protein [Verrucomicrobiota bacterium]
MTAKNMMKAAQRGFTLVELLVVVAILGVLATIAIQNINEHLDNANKTAAKSSVDSIDGAVLSYKIKHGKLPSELRDLIKDEGEDGPILKGGEGALFDPWNNEYRFEKNGRKYAVVCAGMDGEFGTDDDIRSDKTEKKAK